jgi:Uma2 family endonuclease
MAVSTKLVTYEEWLRMPVVEDAIEEVVNGEIRIMPPAKMRHARIVNALQKVLLSQLDDRTCSVFTTQFGLIIRTDPLSSRVPDLAVFKNANIVEVDGYVHSPPELIVEALSPGNTRKERAEKLADYESLGVPEVWVISPEALTVEVMLLKDGKLTTSATLREGQLRPTQFPEASIDIASIWPE